MANLDFINGIIGSILKKKGRPEMAPELEYAGVPAPVPPSDPTTDYLARAQEFQTAQAVPQIPSEQLIRNGRNVMPPVLPPMDTPVENGRPPIMPPGSPIIEEDPDETALQSAQAELAGLERNPDPEHKHSKKSRALAFFENWAKGGLFSGINAAKNPHHYEDERIARERARLEPQVAGLQKTRDANLEARAKRARTETIKIDDARLQRELERKEKADTEKTAYWARKADQGDLKLAGDDELRDLRDKWATSKDKNDIRRLDLVEKEMGNRNIRSDKDRESREKVAGMSQEGQNRRTQLALEARRTLTEYQVAQANGRATEANALKLKLAQMKAEADALK